MADDETMDAMMLVRKHLEAAGEDQLKVPPTFVRNCDIAR